MKTSLRQLCRLKAKSLSLSRRKQAATEAEKTLKPLLASQMSVLSFAPLKNEINLWPLNAILASSQKLLLPRICRAHLEVYHVKNLKESLVLSPWGIWEPDPEKCEKAPAWDLALIPGLAFDKRKHRLGYGKGFYDRLLQENPETQTLGVGFKELYLSEIPTEEHDIALLEVHLF